MALSIVTMARIGAPKGVRGDLKVNVFASVDTDLQQFSHWYIKNKQGWQPLPAFQFKQQGNQWLLRFDGVDDRDEARAFTHAYLGIPRDALPDCNKDEVYWADLEGLQVVNLQNEVLGTVAYLMETGANDVMVLKGERERLLPYVDQVIKQVDLHAGSIQVDWPSDF